MREITSSDPSRAIRIFESFEEQEQETQRYWSTQSFTAKMQAIAEMAEAYARQRGIDINAQGPKRITRSVERTRG